LKRLLSGSLIFLTLAGCQSTALNTADPDSLTHVLRLECVKGDEPGLQSRIGALETNNLKYDFALVAGHAVPDERPCVVKDFSGRQSKVSLKIKTPNLVRYTLEPFEIDRPLNEIPVFFAQAMALPENTQNCRLTALDFPNNIRRISHDCRAISGQSGSPMTTIIDDQHKLVGLHIGH